MNWILTLSLALSLLGGFCQAAGRTQEAQVEVPPPVARRVQPILDAMVAVRKAQATGSGASPEWHKVESLVARLVDDKTPAGNEALVVLIQFYIGEATGEDLLHEVTKRGRSMIPYLRKYMRGPARMPGRDYPASIRANRQTSMGFMETAIESIRAGKIMFED